MRISYKIIISKFSGNNDSYLTVDVVFYTSNAHSKAEVQKVHNVTNLCLLNAGLDRPDSYVFPWQIFLSFVLLLHSVYHGLCPFHETFYLKRNSRFELLYQVMSFPPVHNLLK